MRFSGVASNDLPSWFLIYLSWFLIYLAWFLIYLLWSFFWDGQVHLRFFGCFFSKKTFKKNCFQCFFALLPFSFFLFISLSFFPSFLFLSFLPSSFFLFLSFLPSFLCLLSFLFFLPSFLCLVSFCLCSFFCFQVKEAEEGRERK